MNNNDLYSGCKLVTRERVVGTLTEIDGRPFIDGVECVACTVRKGKETPIKTVEEKKDEPVKKAESKKPVAKKTGK